MVVFMESRSRTDTLYAVIVGAHHGVVAALCSGDVRQIRDVAVAHDNYMAAFWTLLVILYNVCQMAWVRDVLKLCIRACFVLTAVIQAQRCFVIRHIDLERENPLVRRRCVVFVMVSDLFFVASILCVFHGLYIWAGGYSAECAVV